MKHNETEKLLRKLRKTIVERYTVGDLRPDKVTRMRFRASQVAVER